MNFGECVRFGPEACSYNTVVTARFCERCMDGFAFSVTWEGTTKEYAEGEVGLFVSNLEQYCASSPRCYDVLTDRPITTDSCSSDGTPVSGDSRVPRIGMHYGWIVAFITIALQ
ncbi:hypothetical protein BT69DRAFT_380757 [Atractiella rhizophila]|nr:hypothetical protein BT69DRAFT_380757 [Atractiella rhizophila]